MSLFESEEEIIAAIQGGDLAAIKKMKLTTEDVNRPLFVHHCVQIVNDSDHYIFPELIDPTPLIYAIACDQTEILDYFIESTQPDLSLSCNGWKPIHFAAYSKKPLSLRVLLKLDYVQQNVDEPIFEKSKNINGYQTTALHIAVSNHCHGQALLLTQDFPPIEFGLDGKRVLPAFSPVADDSSRQPANPIQLTASGNSPLHIAAFRNDWDMCQILLNVSEENDIRNSSGQTPAEIARSRGYDDLARKIEEMDIEQIEILQQKYLGDINHSFLHQESTGPAPQESVEELQNTVRLLEETINDLSKKIEVFESSE